jgi:uncharacterized glyoxalase superfamily protein PhnB
MSKKRKAVARKTGRKKLAPRGTQRKGRERGGPLRPAVAVPRTHTGSGLAPGMQPINTYLAVANVGASIEFLERTFGFSRGVVLPDADGQLRYAEMRHEDSVVMLIRKGDATSPSAGASALYTYVDDVDRALVTARGAGAGVEDAEDKPWGDRVAVVTDPDGYKWVLATFKKLVPFS